MISSCQTGSSSTTSVATSKGKICSSIMAHPNTEKKIEILGYYWPRLRLRENEPFSCGKKNEKKPIKTRRIVKNQNSVLSTMKLPTTDSFSTSLFDLLYDVPALISEENPHLRSPITGKPIISPRSKGSILIPAKPVRKQLERRSHSNDTFLSHG